MCGIYGINGSKTMIPCIRSDTAWSDMQTCKEYENAFLYHSRLAVVGLDTSWINLLSAMDGVRQLTVRLQSRGARRGRRHPVDDSHVIMDSHPTDACRSWMEYSLSWRMIQQRTRLSLHGIIGATLCIVACQWFAARVFTVIFIS